MKPALGPAGLSAFGGCAWTLGGDGRIIGGGGCGGATGLGLSAHEKMKQKYGMYVKY